MFESFFEMRHTPFSRNIPTTELYESTQLEKIIGRLDYAAERELLAIMTGECGLEKNDSYTQIYRSTGSIAL
ncbi:hypothetical protein [Bacillus sp. P14.5]|uniref:hypothetical protein n=1 Tax=Bacillus sp. P14.5 TaxID=1983400 RepID=UPI001F0530BB|nr:hypothetical protein [Bacillus sp. P14.5]